MQTRNLGRIGPQVPVVCFGAWPIGGGMGLVSEDQAVKTVHAAIDAGMTFIDTAESYRTSEAIIGKAIAGKRNQVFLATKLSGDDHSGEHIGRAIQNSMRALGTDYIDLYQLHSPQADWPIEETMEHLMSYRESGTIRYIGLSNFSAEQTIEASRFGQIYSSQPKYNMLSREANDSILPVCLEQGIGVIPHSVLAKGMLSGRYAPGHQFTLYDERNMFESFQGEEYERLWRIIERLKDWASDQGHDLVQLAIAWVLANPAVTSAIVGAKTPEQVQHNATAADWTLTESDLKEIDGILEGDESATRTSTATVVAPPAEAHEADASSEAREEAAPSEAAEGALDMAEDGEIYTQLLLGLHQDLETQERALGEHVREFASLKGQMDALRSLWITTLAAIILSTIAIVVAILQ